MELPPTPDDPRYLQLRQLTEVSRALTNAVSLEEVFRLTVVRAAQMLGAQRVVLLLANDSGGLTLRAAHNVAAALCDRFREGHAEDLAARLRGLLSVGAEQFLGVPLVAGGQVIGVLAVGRPPADDAEWLLSALADQAAVALEKARLDEVAAFRERLLGIVGHDLKNPLQAIRLAASNLLRHAELDESSTKLTRRIVNSSSRMAEMISQLLDFTRSRLGGGIPLSFAPADLAEVCRAVSEELELAYPGSTLAIDCEGQLDGTWDRDRLSQVLSNLVANAIQHSDAGAVVRIKAVGHSARVRVSVHNCGQVIPAHQLAAIFRPFRRADSGQRSPQGLGLGLYIAEQIVRAHGGRIWATSSQAEGTTFSFELPRAPAYGGAIH